MFRRVVFRKVVAGLMMLATLLVFATPTHAGTPQASEGAMPPGWTVAAPADHGQGPCKNLGLAEEEACCCVIQCAAMHGGLPAVTVAAFVPALNKSHDPAAPAMPAGVGVDPALRPPCPIL